VSAGAYAAGARALMELGAVERTKAPAAARCCIDAYLTKSVATLDLRKVRQALDLELAEVRDLTGELSNDHIAYVLLALHYLMMLRDFDGDPKGYRRRVRDARRQSLRDVIGPGR
jgi:hypothetical protein